MQLANLNMSSNVEDPLAGLNMAPREPLVDGARAPSNSLEAATLESLSFQAAREKQARGSAAPDQALLEARLAALGQLQQGAPAGLDLSRYREALESDPDPDVKRYALLLASLRARAAAEKSYSAALLELRDLHSRHLAMMNSSPWLEVFESWQLPVELSPTDRELLKQVSHVRVEHFAGDIDLLDSVLLRGASEEIRGKDLPGFSVVFVFRDLSELSATYHFDLESPILLQSVNASVSGGEDGQAAAALATLGPNYQGLFAIFTPPTTAELAKSATDADLKGSIQAELQASMAIAQTIKAYLMG